MGYLVNNLTGYLLECGGSIIKPNAVNVPVASEGFDEIKSFYDKGYITYTSDSKGSFAYVSADQAAAGVGMLVGTPAENLALRGNGNPYPTPRRKAFAALSLGLSNASSTPVNILVAGNSQAEGQGATSLTSSVAQQLVRRLRRKYLGSETGGLGFLGVKWGLNSFTVASYTGAFVEQSILGPGGHCVRLNTGSPAGSITYPGLTGTSFKVMYSGSSGTGVGSVSIGGTPAADLNTNTGVALAADILGSTSYTLTGSPQDVVIAWKSGGGVFIEGIMVFNGDETSGVRVWQTAKFGIQANQLLNSPLASGHMALINPDVALLTIGDNEIKLGTSAESMAASVTGYINGVRAATGKTVPFVIEVMPMRADISNTVTDWNAYIAALQGVCDSLGAAIMATSVNALHEKMADYASLYPDSIHGVNSVHALRGELIANAIQVGA